MSKGRIITTARVQVTIDVPSGDSWGPDCALDQVFKQSIDSVRGKLGKLFKDTDIKIIGAPTVTAITTDMSNQ